MPLSGRSGSQFLRDTAGGVAEPRGVRARLEHLPARRGEHLGTRRPEDLLERCGRAALRAEDIMSRSPIIVEPDARMSDVVDLLSANKISNLFVIDERRPVAIIHIAELMQAGYVS